MAPNVKQWLTDATKLFKDLGTSRKLIIGGVLAVLVAGFVYIIGFADMVDYDYLFTNLEDSDAGEIVRILQQKKIPYKTEPKALLIPREKVNEVRMELAAQGLPHSKGVGFELFDTQKLGTSEFVQQLNMNRALQGELSRTIAELDKVEAARVHLVVPKKTLFKEDEVSPSASVVLKMKGGKKLESGEIKAIVHLVSSAVAGLQPNQVNIIDSEGNLLSRASDKDEEQIYGNTPLEYKAKLERDMSRQVEEVVSHIVGVGKVVAKVTVELDMRREEQTEESFDPEAVVVRSEKRVKENRNNSEVQGGVPGAQSNTQAGAQTGKEASNAERERDLINYEINKVVKHTVNNAGSIKRVSVAVLVDGTYATEEAEGKKTEKYVPRNADEMKKIKDVVRGAVGYNVERGDFVEVSNVPFETSILDKADMERSFLERYDFIPALFRYGIILVLAIVMIFFFFRPLVDWVIHFHEEERLREIEREQEDVVKSMEEQLAEVRKTIETSTVEYKTQVQQLAVQAPDLVANVLRVWMNAEN